MNPLGNPARDIIIAADERHYDAMERGSRTLRDAIEAMFAARRSPQHQRRAA